MTTARPDAAQAEPVASDNDKRDSNPGRVAKLTRFYPRTKAGARV